MPVQLVKLLGSPVSISINLNPRGDYDNATVYAVADSVSYNGSSYIAIQPTTGNLPTDTDFWQVLSEKGDQGDTGAQGVKGDKGDPGTDGDDGVVQTVVAGTNVSVDNTDPANPVVSSSASGEVVDDTTPQLGGNLDVNGNIITSSSNGDVTISPDGTGNLKLGNTGGTTQITGDVTLDDTYGLIFEGSTDFSYLRSNNADFAEGELLFHRNSGSDSVLNFAKGLHIYSNTETDGSGSTYLPWIVLNTDESIEIAAGTGGVDITTTSNSDINLSPNGSGKVVIDGNLELDNYGAVSAAHVRNGPDSLGLQIEAGDSSGGTAGDLMLDGGDTSTGTGGDIILKPGAGGSGTAGNIMFKHHTGTKSLKFDYSAISTDRTLTIPDSNINLGNFLTSVQAGDIDSEASTDGYVLTSDGAGNAAWEAVSGGASAIDDLSDVDTDKSKTPADGDVLTFDGTHWNAETPSGGGGGGNPYGADYVIASSGGDYTNLGAYQADSPSAGDVLFIQGTITETSAVTISGTVHLIGIQGKSEIIHTGCALTFSGADTTIKGIKFTRASNTAAYIWAYGPRTKVHNCHFYVTSTSNLQYVLRLQSAEAEVHGCKFELTGTGSGEVIDTSNNYVSIKDNYFVGASGGLGSSDAYIKVQGSYANVSGNRIDGALSTSQGYGIEATGTYTNIYGNEIEYCSYGMYLTGGYATVTGNRINLGPSGTSSIYFTGSFTNLTGNNVAGGSTTINAGGLGSIISSNKIYGSGSGTGISITSGRDDCVIVGNSITNVATGINVTNANIDNTLIMANNIEASGTAISDSGTATFKQTTTDSEPFNQEF